MKLLAICLVKDEADVIAQCLRHAAEFCHKIYVLDNGSTDGSWQIVQALAKENSVIVPYCQTTEPFSNSLRNRIYNEFHELFDEQDWWLILDADEFLVKPPQQAIAQAKQEQADIIEAWQAQFYFTDLEYGQWQKQQEDLKLPILERRCYYQINWKEPRLFRNNPDESWSMNSHKRVPDCLKKVAKNKVINRHYQYRDPIQMAKRFSLRQGLSSDFSHAQQMTWLNQIKPAFNLEKLTLTQEWQVSWLQRRLIELRISYLSIKAKMVNLRQLWVSEERA